jgi:PST family polysaccharide transporter
MQRELQFSRQFACRVGQVIATATAAIPLAAAGAGVWSLVAGQIAGAVVYTGLLLSLSPYHVRPGLDRRAARSLCKTGFGFVLQGGASFIEQNADYAVVATTTGPHQLGLYTMAYRIGEIPYNFVVDPIAQATFPGFARMRNRSEDVADTFLTTLRLTALCTLPLGLIASAAAHPLVASVLGADWIGAVGLLHVLGLWASLRVVHGTIGWFVNSIGASSLIGKSYAALLVVSLPVLVLAANLDGAKGVAWVMVGNVIAMIGIVSTITHRRGGISARRQWHAVRPSALAAVPAWLAASVSATVFADAPDGVTLAISLASGFSAYAGAVAMMDRTVVGDVRRQLGRILAPSS